MNEEHDSDEPTPQQEPAATPLVSAEHLSLSQFHVEHIPQRRLDPLQEIASRIAETWWGTDENHTKGLLGEDAVARSLGIQNQLDVEVYPDGGDGGVDLCYNGATIDVKTVGRHRTDPALTVGAYEALTADYYVLVSRIGPSDFRLLGYAPRCFVANAPVMSHRGDPYHIVGQEYLFPFPTIR